MYGMGDQFGYREWFWMLSACCTISWHRRASRLSRLLANGRLQVPSKKPIIADGQLFVGLALDETNQYDLSDERLQTVRTDSGRNGREVQLTRIIPASVAAAVASGAVPCSAISATVGGQPQMLALTAAHGVTVASCRNWHRAYRGYPLFTLPAQAES